MEINWQPHATKALREIYRFYARLNTRVADKIVDTILSAVARLSVSPEMAPIEQQLEGLPDIYRSVVAHKLFKVVYVVDKDAEQIVIISVWDCRQNPEKLRRGIIRTKS